MFREILNINLTKISLYSILKKRSISDTKHTKYSILKGVFAKNERGYRLNAMKNRV